MNHHPPSILNLHRRSRKVIAGLCLFFSATPALAELMLYPTRVVFEGNERSAQVELMNNGSSPATYRISLVNRRMDDTGVFSPIEEPLPSEWLADAMLRYSPRQVTLAPGEGQTVRLMVRKPAGLESGEYRSHLLFSKQPTVDAANTAEGLSAGSEGIGVQITALVGASIPVIVRHGETNAGVALKELALARDANQTELRFTIERNGNQSVYGDLTVTYAPRGGQAEVVARANGVAVYTPNPVRRASLALQLDKSTLLTGGTLELVYRQPAEDGGKLLGSASLVVP